MSNTPTASVSYVPLLEGVNGKLYLSNTTDYTLAFPVGLQTPQQALTQNVVTLTGDAAIQGHLSLAHNATTARYELNYNAAQWDPNLSDAFQVNVTLHDVAESGGGQLDVYPYATLTSRDGLISNPCGGSVFSFYVWPLVVPEVAAISPSTIPADGAPHTLTISLKRRLHSTQNPTVTFASTGSANWSFASSVIPVRNSAGQITAYTVTATAATGQSTSVNTITMTAHETLQYLNGDYLASVPTTYASAVTIGQVKVGNATALNVTQRLLQAGSGTFNLWGQFSATQSYFMGGLLAIINVTSSISTGFGKVEIVAKPTGSNNRQILAIVASGTDIGNTLDASGNTVYQRLYNSNFDTTSLSSYNQWDLGYIVYDATGSAVVTDWWGSFWNGNLTSDLASFNVYAVMGTTTYKWNSHTGWDSTPTFKGLAEFYISENWNTFNVVGSELNTWDTLTWAIGSGSVTSVTSKTRKNFSGDWAVQVASLDTSNTSLFASNGNYTLNLAIGSTLAVHNGGSNHALAIPMTTNQSVAGGTTPSFTITTVEQTDMTFDKALGSSYQIAWDFTTATQNQYVGNVAFSVTGLPPNAIGVFNPSSGSFVSSSSVGPTTTLQINAYGSTVGTYPLVIHAISGSLEKTIPLTLRVRDTRGGHVNIESLD